MRRYLQQIEEFYYTIILSTLKLVSKDIIKHCQYKADILDCKEIIVSDSVERELAKTRELIKIDFDKFKSTNDITVEQHLEFDQNHSDCLEELTDSQIVDVIKNKNNATQEDDDDVTEKILVTHKEVKSCLKCIKTFLEQQSSLSPHHLEIYEGLEDLLLDFIDANRTQTTIEDYFM